MTSMAAAALCLSLALDSVRIDLSIDRKGTKGSGGRGKEEEAKSNSRRGEEARVTS
jgi:hypothetical protein